MKDRKEAWNQVAEWYADRVLDAAREFAEKGDNFAWLVKNAIRDHDDFASRQFEYMSEFAAFNKSQKENHLNVDNECDQ